MREYRQRIPSCIVRPAAIFSDWCEYEPLDVFLRTWCSQRWNARVLGGRGLSAIPYLHVEDLLSLLVRVVEKSDDLGSSEVLQATPDGCTTHLELFREATRAFFGAPRTPWFVPVPLARKGMRLREQAGRLTGSHALREVLDGGFHRSAAQRRRFPDAPPDRLGTRSGPLRPEVPAAAGREPEAAPRGMAQVERLCEKKSEVKSQRRSWALFSRPPTGLRFRRRSAGW